MRPAQPTRPRCLYFRPMAVSCTAAGLTIGWETSVKRAPQRRVRSYARFSKKLPLVNEVHFPENPVSDARLHKRLNRETSQRDAFRGLSIEVGRMANT